jgi:hypothetical protein
VLSSADADRPAIAWGPLGAASALGLVLHLAVNAVDRYGIFRDEYYYLACADRLAWGYVDHPPLSIVLLAAVRSVLGDSLFALRLVPAFLGAGTALVSGLVARELGGAAFAQALAALLVTAVPGYLGLFGYFSMNGIDVLVWAVAFWIAARLASGADPRLWLALGALLGLGLLNKLSVLWLGAGLVVACAATGWRRHLRTPWPWLGGAIAAAVALPHALWQLAHGWPTLEFMRNAATHKNVALSPGAFLTGVTMEANPALAPLWIGGLVALLAGKRFGAHRWAAVLWLTVLAVLLASGSAKPYYALASLSLPFAAGAVAVEAWTAHGRARGVLRALVVTWTLAALALVAPFALPILSPERFVAWSRALGVTPRQAERSTLGALPQFFADRFGWRELAAEVGRIAAALPPEDRERAVIYTTNYGRAAALEYWADEYDLPPVISGHNSYWTWGPGDTRGEVVIVVDDEPEESQRRDFEEVVTAGAKRCEWCMPYENDVPIRVCRGLRAPLEQVWPRLRHFI